MTGYAAKDLPGFQAFATAAPVIVEPGQAGPHGQPPVAPGQMDATALAVCSRLGIDPAAFKQNQEGA